MKLYEQYLFNEQEEALSQAKKELAVPVNKESNLWVYKHDLSGDETIKYIEQHSIIVGCYYTMLKLFHLENKGIECCSGGGCINFHIIVNEINNQQIVNCSPRLSREKLLPLNSFEIVNVIIDLFLDRNNWSKKPMYSTRLSDDNGNWL